MNTVNTEGKFMVAVGAIIENTATGKILLVRRSETADYEAGTWEGISGRVKQFEGHEEALHREIKEETGLEITVVKPITVEHIFRGEMTAEKELFLITFWCQTSTEEVVISSEHSEYKWLLPQEALEFIKHPGVKKDIEIFMKEWGANQYANI